MVALVVKIGRDPRPQLAEHCKDHRKDLRSNRTTPRFAGLTGKDPRPRTLWRCLRRSLRGFASWRSLRRFLRKSFCGCCFENCIEYYKYTQYTKCIKYDLWNLEKYILNVDCSKHFERVGFLEIYLCMFGVFCIIICQFNAFIGFCVIFCIYEQMLKLVFHILQNVYILVWSAVTITSTVGGNYYWYGRR